MVRNIHKPKKPNKMSNRLPPDMKYFKMLKAAAVIALVFVIALIALSGCSGTKAIESTTSATEEKTTVDSSAYYKLQAETTKEKLEESLKKVAADLAFYQDNNDELARAFENVQDLFIEKGILSDSLNQRLRSIFDSLKNNPCKPKLEVRSDGSWIASGVKNANFELLEQNRKIEVLTEQLEAEINTRLLISEEKKQLETALQIEKKRGVTFFGALLKIWWLLLIVAIGSAIYGLIKGVQNAEKIRAIGVDQNT